MDLELYYLTPSAKKKLGEELDVGAWKNVASATLRRWPTGQFFRWPLPRICFTCRHLKAIYVIYGGRIFQSWKKRYRPIWPPTSCWHTFPQNLYCVSSSSMSSGLRHIFCYYWTAPMVFVCLFCFGMCVCVSLKAISYIKLKFIFWKFQMFRAKFG